MNTASRRITTGLLMSVLMGLIIAAAVASSGCTSGPELGTLRVSGSCSRAGTIDVFIDGAGVGSIGGSGSGDFPLAPGTHSVSARGGVYSWPSRSVSIVTDQVFTLRLLC